MRGEDDPREDDAPGGRSLPLATKLVESARADAGDREALESSGEPANPSGRSVTTEGWRRRARRRLPRFAFDYLDGGAGSERCIERNRNALDALTLIPEVLCDVSEANTTVTMFGREHPYPVVVAPIGLSGLFWRDGDVALARAASRAGIPSVISTASTSRISDVAAANSGNAWFQLYVFGDRFVTESLIRRAADAGCSVLMLTVDTAVGGNRLRDARNGFTAPFRPHPRMIVDALAHPRWLLNVMRFGAPELVNIDGSAGADRAALLARNMERSLTWKSIDWLREQWSGPLVLKGVLRASDARRAGDCGVDAVVVSNHGGRQLDSAPASIDVLPAVVDAVGREIPVMIDSGFRSGTDIVKALAIGARAVLVGRALLYPLAVGGERAVQAALRALIEDLVRTMRLLGVADVRKLRRDHVQGAANAPFGGGFGGGGREEAAEGGK